VNLTLNLEIERLLGADMLEISASNHLNNLVALRELLSQIKRDQQQESSIKGINLLL